MIQYGLEEDEIAAIKNILAQHEEVEQAILYGSRAKGNFKPASDIDLVLKGEKLNISIQNKIANELDDLLLPYIFDLSVFHQISNGDLLEHIERIGVILYHKGQALEIQDWKDEQLDNLIDTLIDYRGKTPTKTTSGIPLITAKIVKDGFIQEPNEFIAVDNYQSWMTRGLPELGDVVLTTEAPLGEVAQIKDKNIALAQRIVTLRGKKGILDNGYLKYFLQSEIGQQRLKERETGSTVSGIKQSELRKVLIRFPSINQQVVISNTLSSLDSKIELNRQINQTLEEMVKSFFFKKCISKGNELPEGWRVGKLGDFVAAIGGTTPSTRNEEFWNGDYNWATPKDLSNLTSPILLKTERKITEKGLRQISSGLLPRGTLLMSSRAPIGYLALSDVPLAINQGFIAVVGKSVSNLFMLNWLKANIDLVKSMGNGSTFLEINKSVFRDLRIVIPSTSVLREFDDFATPIYNFITDREKEIVTLTLLRDKLLLSFMKGEINVMQNE